jgi:hypothetical protein
MDFLTDLKKGDVVTLIGIGDMLAMTYRKEAYATGEYIAKTDPQGNVTNKPVFKDGPRKRNTYTLRAPSNDTLVFVNLPRPSLTLDSEAPAKGGIVTYQGNACLNFMQTPLEIRAIIETCNRNPLFTGHAHILSHATNPPVPAYPELETHHAIINRYKEPCVACEA